MITDFKNKVAVLTGAGSGFGLECARIGAQRGMKLVLADVQQDALNKATAELTATGAEVLALQVDVSDVSQMEHLAHRVQERFGAPHFVFNNAGVGAGGLVWENSVQDWQWVLGVNLWGVIHGVRLFTPMMLEAAQKDPAYRGHIVNTASMAGLLNAPNMGVYNVSKHAVVSLSETLYQDLALVTEQVSASVLCPYFVPTGIHQSERNRPGDRFGADAAGGCSAGAQPDRPVCAQAGARGGVAPRLAVHLIGGGASSTCAQCILREGPSVLSRTRSSWASGSPGWPISWSSC